MSDKTASGGIYDVWKSAVPAEARIYLQALFGDRTKPFTAQDFTPEELRTLNAAIERAHGKLTGAAQDNLAQASFQSNQSPAETARLLNYGEPKALMAELQRDPQWQRYQRMLSSAESPGSLKDYAKLGDTLAERYDHRFPPGSISSVRGKDESGVRRQYSQAYRRFMDQQYEGVGSLQKDASRALAKRMNGVGYVGYGDYPHPATPEETPFSNMSDTLGRFNYRRNPDGTISVRDTYDFFNEGRKSRVEEYENMSPVAKAALVAARTVPLALNPRAAAGEIGMAYMGRDGRPVDIRYNPADLKEQK